jgi:hypothetical protein
MAICMLHVSLKDEPDWREYVKRFPSKEAHELAASGDWMYVPKKEWRYGRAERLAKQKEDELVQQEG